jgi:urocanate hydratase
MQNSLNSLTGFCFGKIWVGCRHPADEMGFGKSHKEFLLVFDGSKDSAETISSVKT